MYKKADLNDVKLSILQASKNETTVPIEEVFHNTLKDYVSNGINHKWHKNEKFSEWHKFHATGALEKSRTIFS